MPKLLREKHPLDKKHTLGKVQAILKVLTLIQLQGLWLTVFYALPFIMQFIGTGQLLQGSHWLGSHNLGIEFEKDIMKDISLNKQGIFLFLQLPLQRLSCFYNQLSHQPVGDSRATLKVEILSWSQN